LNVFIIFTFLGSTRHGNLSVFMFYDFETTIIRIFEIIYDTIWEIFSLEICYVIMLH